MERGEREGLAHSSTDSQEGRSFDSGQSSNGGTITTTTSPFSTGLGFGHLPFPMLGGPPLFSPAPPFGGFGSFAGLHAASAIGLPPSTGGADWWRAASEHARRAAMGVGMDYFQESLANSYPPAFPLVNAHLFSLAHDAAAMSSASFLHSSPTSATTSATNASPMSTSSIFAGSLFQPAANISPHKSLSKSHDGSYTKKHDSWKPGSTERSTAPTNHKSSSPLSATRHGDNRKDRKRPSSVLSMPSSSPMMSSRCSSSPQKSPRMSLSPIVAPAKINLNKNEESRKATTKTANNDSKEMDQEPNRQQNEAIRQELEQSGSNKSSSSISWSKTSVLSPGDKPTKKSDHVTSDLPSPKAFSPTTIPSFGLLANSNLTFSNLANKPTTNSQSLISPTLPSLAPAPKTPQLKGGMTNDKKVQLFPGLMGISKPSASASSAGVPSSSNQAKGLSLLARSNSNSLSSRGRGRPPKLLKTTQPPLLESHEEVQRREKLKFELEAQIKLQQQQLRLAKKQLAEKGKGVVSNIKTPDGAASEKKFKPQQSKLAQALMGRPDPTLTSHMPEVAPPSDKSAKKAETIVAKFKTMTESSADSDDSDDSDDSSDSSSSESSGADNQAQSTVTTPTKTPASASAGTDNASSAVKRRRVVNVNEDSVKLPLDHGWKRQTRIRGIGPKGIVGEVLYITPCRRKLRTYPDVSKYLVKVGSNLTRENFSFSTRVTVGDFYEARQTTGENASEKAGYVLLTEEEVIDRLTQIVKRKPGRNQGRMSLAHKNLAKLLAKKAACLKVRRRQEQQELAKKSASAKAEKESQKKQKMEKALLKAKERDGLKEKRQLQKNMKSQQVMEDREMKRQQALMMKEQEKERRRQHMLLVKALEARKKQEERERQKEEKNMEKKLNRQKKMEIKKLEIEMAKEMKKPIEDMMLKDMKPLPDFTKLQNVRLSGEAFADCLMVIEFLHNFGNALSLDISSLPTLDSLQVALLNEDETVVEEVMSLAILLQKMAIEDPGVPNEKEAVTLLKQKITDIELNEENLSEVMRIFMICRNGKEDKMSLALKKHPFQSLSQSLKAAILAFLCNELLCSSTIVTEIDKNIDVMATLRKDKWLIEGKLRKHKLMRQKKTKKAEKPANGAVDESLLQGHEDSNMTNGARNSKRGSDDEGSGNESENEDDGNEDGANDSDAEDDKSMSIEELDKKIEKLSKQQTSYRNKVCDCSHKLRASHLGQDRYKRLYWVLPCAGGVYVQGMEPEHDGLETKDSNQENKVNSECAISKNEINIKEEVIPLKIEKSEPEQIISKDVSQDKVPQIDCDKRNGDVEPTNTKSETADSSVEDSNLFLQHSTSRLIMNGPMSEHEESKECMSKLILKDSIMKNDKKSFVSIDSILQKEEPKTHINGHMTDSVKGQNDNEADSCQGDDKIKKPWFSVLPRTPCDTHTLTGMPKLSTSINTTLDGKSDISAANASLHSVYSPYQFNCSTPTFAAFQMGHLRTTPLDLSSGGPNSDSLLADTHIPSSSSCKMESHQALLESLQYKESQPIPPEFQEIWWRINDQNQVKDLVKCLQSRGIRERFLTRNLNKNMDIICQSCSKGNKKVVHLNPKVESTDEEDEPTPGKHEFLSQVAMEIEMATLEDVESLEERVYSASLQVKGWKLPEKASEDETITIIPCDKECTEENERYPLDLARQRLSELEVNIERRYLKPPLGEGVNINMNDIKHNKDDCSSDEEEDKFIPKALVAWRQAVSMVTNSSQLVMCMVQLNNSIAWEKSIMKVLCQICCKDDNEAELLLCDGCDKGYHTYCFKPKMDTIPDGTWYCYECVSKAAGTPHCLVCGKKNGRLVKCDECPKAFHIEHLYPPLPKVPKKWCCSTCLLSKGRPKGKRGRKSKQEKALEKLQVQAGLLQDVPERERRCNSEKDLTPCRLMLAELEDHEFSWPFLDPVNTKVFPQYKKVIRHPMDLQTISRKMDDFVYKTRTDYASDVRLIFDNCETFNEDDSDVGEAGHALRSFFEERWSELCSTY